MPRLSRATALVALLIASPLTAAAQPPSAAPAVADPASVQPTDAAAPTVEELIGEALAHAPSLLAARAELAARQAAEPAAGALPDPMVETMLQNAGVDWTVGEMEMSMLGAELRQELPYPGKRAAARSAAEAATARVHAELVHRERQLVLDLRMLYGELYAIDGELATLAAADELLELLAATTRARYAAGEADAAALLRAQLERTRLAERSADLLAERVARLAELNRWVGRPADTPLPPLPSLPAVGTPPGSIAELVVHGATEVAMREAAVDEASAVLALRRLDLRPDFTAGAGIGWRGDLDPVVTLRFGVRLPAWRDGKQRRLVTAAEHELAAAGHRVADVTAMAEAETTALLVRFRTASEQVVRYREGTLPQTAAAFDAARASYLGDRTGFAELLESFTAWLQARAGLARREADRFAAWARLEHLSSGHREQGELP